MTQRKHTAIAASAKRHVLATAISVAILATTGASAYGQDAAPKTQQASRTALEEVIVTGTKREVAAQDVPIAITALSAEQLDNTFRNDILAVSDLAPGVTMGQMVGFRAVSGGIRGTGSNSILTTQDASTAIIVDEFGLNNVQAQFVEAFDVERIEIFRGPQGTLFGKNSTGGAISVVTKRPVIDEMSADVEYQFGAYSVNDAKMDKLKVALNVPLIDNTLAMRVSYIRDQDDGYFTNDKESSPFPELMPIWQPIFGDTPPPLPPELDTTDQGGGENIGGVDVEASKVKLLWTPNENYEAYFIAERLRDRSDSPPGVNETPSIGEVDPTTGPQFQLNALLGFFSIHDNNEDVYSSGITDACFNKKAFCINEGHQVDVDGFYLHQKYVHDDFTYQLIAGYREQQERLPSTYTGEAFQSLFDAARSLEREATQLEFRMSSDMDGPFNYTAGATYQEDNVDFVVYQTVGLLSLVTFLPDGFLDERGYMNLDLDYINDPQMQRAVQDRTTYAAYFDGSYDVNDRLTLTAGLRWTLDKKEFQRQMNPGGPCTDLTPAKDAVTVDGECLDARSTAWSRTGLPLTSMDPYDLYLPDSAYALNADLDDEWEKITYRLVADYQLTDEALLYGSYSTGFISGGYTEQCSSAETCIPYDEETNWNLEGGLKARWWEGKLQTNFAVYYTRYEDLIRSQVVPFTDAFGNTTQETVNVNVGESTAYGMEAEISWVVTDAFRLDLTGAYLKHEYEDFTLDGYGDLSDLDVPYSPEWMWSAAGLYDWNLDSAGSVTLNVSANYQSEAEMSVFNSLYSQMDSRLLVDAALTWRDADERYKVTFWGKNLTDEEYRIGANPVAGLWNFTYYGRPMSYGVEIGAYF